MNAFFDEVGRKLADRWLTVLLLPGLLFCGAALAAVALGHAHALDAGRFVSDTVGRVATIRRGDSASPWVLIPVLALAACAAALGARFLGGMVRRVWLGQWPGWTRRLLAPLVRKRARRWQAAADAYADAVLGQAGDNAVERLAARRNAIALAPPTRPSWTGDRIAAVDARVRATYELDLASAWPRLWTLLPDNLRADLRSAGSSFDNAATLAGWAVLYAGVGIGWWPGFAIGLACFFAAVHRARGAIAAFADLIEASVDLHGPDLAQALKLTETHQELTPRLGRLITAKLRKGS
ncbi:hypothetical protein [Amycolatopsis sp. NPDC004378]